VVAALDCITCPRERGCSTTILTSTGRGMRKQTIHSAPPQERRSMGLRWGVVRRYPPSSRNDHIHLFSTENNARRIREALEELDAGGGHRIPLEGLWVRFGLGGV
jgi:hypothetical protein